MRFYVFASLMLLVGCGDTVNNVYTKQCTANTECNCPTGSSSSCQSGMCFCSSTVIKQCSVKSDCSCPANSLSDCSAGICYCSSVSEECSDITRAQLMKLIIVAIDGLANYKAPATPTFKDVPADTWYFDYIEAATQIGIIDASENFRPNDTITHAEAVKIIITAMDGLANYEKPATPTFDDVSPDSWFYDYVESAVQLGLVHGYVDPSGNLTGKFGPADNASRCWVSDMILNGLPTIGKPAGSLTISKAAVPVSVTYVQGTKSVPVLGIVMTAGSSTDITVTQLSVRFYADSLGSSDFSATGDTSADSVVATAWLYSGVDIVAGPMPLNLFDTGAFGFVADSGDFFRTTFKNLEFKVAKGSSHVLTVKVDLQNTLQKDVFLAADVVPADDVFTETSPGMGVVPYGAPLNQAPGAHDPEIRVKAGTGTIKVNQIGGVGFIQLIGPAPTITIKNSTYVDSTAPVYSYYSVDIAPPMGHVVEKVTDGSGNILSSPFYQSLTVGATITFNVFYKVSAGTVVVNQIGAVGTIMLNGPALAVSITTPSYSTVGYAGSYTLSLITPPSGYKVDKITDGTGVSSTMPYNQLLVMGSIIIFNVYYTPL